MALINQTSSKNFYTQDQDKQIVKLRNEGKSVPDIAKVVGHSEASVQYRINRVLSKADKFEDIKYRGAVAAAASKK